MNGTVFALAAAFVAELALLALIMQKLGIPAKPTRKEPKRDTPEPVKDAADVVTRAELDAFRRDMEQRTEWVLNEWYEKFSTLHARLSKRVARAAQGSAQVEANLEEPQPVRSVLAFRRLGSP